MGGIIRGRIQKDNGKELNFSLIKRNKIEMYNVRYRKFDKIMYLRILKFYVIFRYNVNY